MVGRQVVHGGGDHLGPHVAPHVRDLLRSLVDQQDDEDDLRMVRRDAAGDLLEEHGLARLRRGHDQAALPLADGGQQVEHPRGGIGFLRFEGQTLVRIDRDQLREGTALPVSVRVAVIEGIDGDQRRAGPPARSSLCGTGDRDPLEQSPLADEVLGNGNVPGRGKIVVLREPEKPVPVRHQLEDAGGGNRLSRRTPLRGASGDRHRNGSLTPGEAVVPVLAGRTEAPPTAATPAPSAVIARGRFLVQVP